MPEYVHSNKSSHFLSLSLAKYGSKAQSALFAESSISVCQTQHQTISQTNICANNKQVAVQTRVVSTHTALIKLYSAIGKRFLYDETRLNKGKHFYIINITICNIQDAGCEKPFIWGTKLIDISRQRLNIYFSESSKTPNPSLSIYIQLRASRSNNTHTHTTLVCIMYGGSGAVRTKNMDDANFAAITMCLTSRRRHVARGRRRRRVADSTHAWRHHRGAATSARSRTPTALNIYL